MTGAAPVDRISRTSAVLTSIVLTIACAVLATPLGVRPLLAQEPELPSDEAPRFEVVHYVAPVLTEVIDPFRPPAHIGAPGNRGLEYGNSDNRIVAAAASGYVLFAGPVAGRKAVTIVHADGVRTTYTGLLEVWAVAGMTVNQHSAIARASSGFHFGAKLGDHYLDPQILIDAGAADLRPRLVPPPSDPG